MLNFDSIDLFFSDKVLSQGSVEQKNFLSSLMHASLQGHLCIEGDCDLPDHKWIHREGNRWYLQRNWKFETKFIDHLKRLNQSIDSIISEKIPELNAEQQHAVDKALQYNISLISGGPGTGKSFVASHLVKLFLNCGYQRIVVTAPTGKAAAHLESKIEKDPRVKCGTLHHVLGVRSSAELNNVAGHLIADLIIVDECSMIDVRLFSYLLASIQEGTKVILMGDPNQLPPVDAGSLFADLIEAAKLGYPLAWTLLNKCLRTDRTEILSLAEAIREGKNPGVTIEPFHIDIDSFFSAGKNVCILSTLREGPLGVDTLNREIAEHFKGRANKAPIMITKNDYQLKLFNGQSGQLLHEEGVAVFGERKIPVALLPAYEFAYVLSVHKSQGSEYDEVLLLIPPGSEHFGREVLYTAVTRARHKLSIQGSEEIFKLALESSSRKKSGIVQRLL